VKKVGEIKDPVHGYIYFSEVEKKIIDSSPLQRLRRIKQLAGAELTYPGALHTRFNHSLGVMHLSGLIGTHLKEASYITEDEVQKLRLAGLLHDVGHGPFSHVYEEILDKYRKLTHEDLSRMIVRESEIGEILTEHGYSKDEISQLSTGALRKKGKDFLNQAIAGHFSSDIMDYLVRDSYFAGVEYGKIDVHRLVSSLDLIDSKLVADYSDAFGVIESFIIARVEMFNVVYFHRTVRATNVMVARAMDFAEPELGLCSFNTVDDFLQLDDSTVTAALLSLKKTKRASSQHAYDLITRIRNRHLLKSTYELTIYRKDDFFANLLNKVNIRNQLEIEIGEKAGIDPKYVIIDVPQVLSVPINPIERKKTEILVSQMTSSGKVLKKVTELSPLLGSLSKFIDIVRVYTMPEYREKVGPICEEIMGHRPFSTKISM
jgi:HD superfamily phosphohydrolase